MSVGYVVLRAPRRRTYGRTYSTRPKSARPRAPPSLSWDVVAALPSRSNDLCRESFSRSNSNKRNFAPTARPATPPVLLSARSLEKRTAIRAIGSASVTEAVWIPLQALRSDLIVSNDSYFEAFWEAFINDCGLLLQELNIIMEKFLSNEQIAKLLDHWDSEDGLDLAAPTNFESEYEDSASEHSSHRSDTKMELDSHDESNASSDDGVPLSHLAPYTGKNGFKWSKTPSPASRTRAHNLIRHLPGIKGPALSNDNLNPLECWEVIFTKDIIDMLVIYTNDKITSVKNS
ncbi:hypothetical protein EVAR_85991_1 [Eumeta japonica]|uniref:Uncharacterized protein n=1 Tax=Eumeta variegata TaxID=151549 RepID=A0A4C1UJJ0_EUMVA|nr:hypothetical protein EVAR_85991_1 [Eumeta japonica]